MKNDINHENQSKAAGMEKAAAFFMIVESIQINSKNREKLFAWII
jgi:hypothetical protein